MLIKYRRKKQLSADNENMLMKNNRAVFYQTNYNDLATTFAALSIIHD